MPGPTRKRDAERRRRNKDETPTIRVNLDEAIGAEIEIPAPPMIEGKFDEDGAWVEFDEPVYEWAQPAVDWYLSLSRSGQAIFYEPSDWMTAWLLAQQISLALEPRPVQIGTNAEGDPQYRTMVMPMPGAALNAFLKGASALMATEGERRRLRIELDRKKRADAMISGDGKVASIAAKREDVFRREARG